MDSFHMQDDVGDCLLPETMPDVVSGFPTLENPMFAFSVDNEEPASLMFAEDQTPFGASTEEDVVPVGGHGLAPVVKEEELGMGDFDDAHSSAVDMDAGDLAEMSRVHEEREAEEVEAYLRPHDEEHAGSDGSSGSSIGTGSGAGSGSASPTGNKKGKKRKPTKLATKLPPPQKPQEDMSEEEKKEFKRKQRLLRNRVSAQLSRERKKAYVGVLEEQMKEMAEQNKALSAKVAELAAQNVALRQRLEKMEHSDNSSASGSAKGGESPVFFTVHGDYEAEDMGPGPLKRYKSVNGRNARAGMVLFALVFSFGMFFHISGVDILHKEAPAGKMVRLSPDMSISPGVFRGRVLQSIAMTEAEAETENHKVPSAEEADKLSLVAVTTGAYGDQKVNQAEDDTVTHLQPIHMASLSKQLHESIINIGLNVNSTDVAAAAPKGKVEAPAPVYINGDVHSKAVQHYDEHQNSIHKALQDALHMYRSLYLKETNGTLDDNMPSSILFCPSAIHVHTDGSKNAVVNTHNKDANSSMGADNNMLLWVPSSSISTGWKHALPRRMNENEFKGVTEMSLKVNSLREVV